MPRVVVHATPNPDSLKFTAEPDGGEPARAFIESGLAAFRSPAEASGDPLGEALFSIPGVADVLVLPTFVTVTKAPAATWEEIAGKIERVLSAHLHPAA